MTTNPTPAEVARKIEWLSDNQVNVLSALKRGNVRSSKAKTVASLVVLGLARFDGVARREILTPLGETTLRAKLDRRNAASRRKSQARRDRINAEANRCNVAMSLGEEECQRRIDQYHADANAAGRQVGLVQIGANGQPYEWCSWERMMSE